jgi:hypothetical protein
MKIFIGSSSHYVTLTTDKSNVDEDATKRDSKLYPIINFLRSKGHIVEPWWEDGVLQKGEYLLDSLILKSHSCDAGIFVLRPDDLLKPENIKKTTAIEVGVPRGNVLIECGMFLGARGKARTFILKDGDFSKIKIPNDILAINYADLSNKNINSELDYFFNNEKLKEDNKSTKFYLSKSHTDNIFAEIYKNWSSKALYIGSKSARLWQDLENIKDDQKTLTDRSEVREFIEKIHNSADIEIDYKKVNNVISLGPGCGKFDNEIVAEVFLHNNSISYVPIDINPYMAYKASEYIKHKSINIRVPFAIIDDFEDSSNYVAKILKTKFHDIGQTSLFLMLGGTFSNLEGDEETVIAKIKSWMGKSDYFIIDAFIKPKNYVFENDKKRQVSELAKNETYKNFILNSIEKRHLIKEKNKLVKVKKDLANYLKGETQSEKNIYTKIGNTSVVSYVLNLDNNKAQDIFIVKRYDFTEITKFLTKHFIILDSFNGLNSETELNKSDRGIFLLQKK